MEGENENFRLKSISEFLDGTHHFNIPSYQRGYRWDEKQVNDLLKDIWDFAKESVSKDRFYCLQPIVIKANGEFWDVIDGQQRLTTLKLLLTFIKELSRTPFVTKSELYDIQYATRKELDFDKPDALENIDGFYIHQAKSVIEKWFEKRIDEVDYSAFEKVLFNKSPEVPQVKVIWYVVEGKGEEDKKKDDEEVESIKVFNNLNKGKIGLTNAELIKALFVLKSTGEKKEKGLNIEQFAYEWNEIENQLHDNRFWSFLSNTDYNPATRIDLIFDFLTKKQKDSDDDFSYRKFQKLYDEESDRLWENESGNQMTFTEVWQDVKGVYQTFIYWFEDQALYHYIGYLISIGADIKTIHSECSPLPKNLVVQKLRKMIGERLRNKKTLRNEADLNQLIYPNNRREIERVLLLFNIGAYVKQTNETNPSGSFNRFPFDRYKNENWDIEHIGSQTENQLSKIEDKIVWLSYIENLVPEDLEDHTSWQDLQKRAKDLLSVLKNKGKDDGKLFEIIYRDVLLIVQKAPVFNDDTLKNLALLDAGTNRGYGNALFPTKRKIIIANEKEGVFVPICTRNLFLKYYSQDDKGTSQWKNNWTDSDGKAYLKAIHDEVTWIFN